MILDPASAAQALRAICVALLVLATFTDIRERRVPNLLSLVLLLTGLLAALSGGVAARDLLAAAFGVVVGLMLWLPFWLLGLLGAGDVKLFAAACAWLGPGLAWRASLAVAVLGGLMAAAVLARRRGVRHLVDFTAIGVTRPTAMLPTATPTGTPMVRTSSFPYAVPMAIVAALALLRPTWFY